MKELTRWPLLLGGVILASVGIGLDLTTQAPVAYGLWALASACLGAFLYAEGARHREWWEQEQRRDTPEPGAHAGPTPGA